MTHGKIKQRFPSWGRGLILGDLSGHSYHGDPHLSVLKLSVPLLPIVCFHKDLAGDPWLGLNDPGVQ